jgi:alpha-beta hydrolase superfamily lysophospholipase
MWQQTPPEVVQNLPDACLYRWTQQTTSASSPSEFINTPPNGQAPVDCVPLLIHGLGGCLAWMEPFIDALTQYFGTVYGLDNQLYGPNPTGIGNITHHNQLTQSVEAAIHQTYQHSGKPVLLVGLSLGALIAVHAVAGQPKRLPLAGMVLVSPAFKGAAASFKAKTYAQVLVGALLTKSTTPIGLPYDMTSITSDPEQQQRVGMASGCVRALPPGSYLQLLKLTLSRKGFDRLNYPMLMMRAAEDTICDTTAMDAEWKRWPHPNKQAIVFANVCHDLVLEPIKGLMAHHIYAWHTGQALSASPSALGEAAPTAMLRDLTTAI